APGREPGRDRVLIVDLETDIPVVPPIAPERRAVATRRAVRADKVQWPHGAGEVQVRLVDEQAAIAVLDRITTLLRFRCGLRAAALLARALVGFPGGVRRRPSGIGRLRPR